MTPDSIAGLREDETTEFKERWNEHALEDLAAFANHRGGLLLVGVRDDGHVVGLRVGDADLQRIANQIVDTLGIRPRMDWREAEGHPVLAVHVLPADGLVPCRGRYLTRVGSTNRELSQEAMTQRLLARSGRTWDAFPVPADSPGARISEAAVRRFIRLARSRLPALLEDDPPSRVLENLRLVDGPRLRRAALLLFGDDPQALFPAAQVHVGRFGAGGIILDDRRIGGDLFTQLDEVLARLRGYLQVRLEVGQEAPNRPSAGGLESLQRREVWDYPLDALREALVNALIHRDYAALGDIQVRVAEDQLDVWNPGGLPEGLSSEDLRREGHVSRPRNPLMAQVFYYAGLVEGWGTGTTRMIAACRAQGLPEPEFREEAGGLRVTFHTNPFAPERLRAMGLHERQVRALADLHDRGSQGELTNQQYQGVTGASRATASRDLENLVERGLLRRIGRTGRSARYVLGSGNAS